MNTRATLGIHVTWLFITCLTLAQPVNAQGGDFMDVRLTWTLGDDDVLHRAGDEPDSPLPGIWDRPGYELFYENLDTGYSGHENITHLVLYKSVPSLLDERLTVDLAAVMLIDFAALYANSDYVINVFRDDGSYIRMTYSWSPTRPQDGLEIVLFPLDTNRFRVGYLYDLSWGGLGNFVGAASSMTPGLKLQVRVGNVYAFAGMKLAFINQQRLVEEDVVNVRETNYGGLAGVGMDALPWLRFDLSGGFFQMGTFRRTSNDDVDPAFTYGGAARLVFHQGIPIRVSPDFMLYRNDPMAEQILSLREEYVPGQFSWSLAMEGHVIGQHLQDAEDTDATTEQLGYATALQFLMKLGYLRAHLTGMVRSAGFILQRRPSLVPYQAMVGDCDSVLDPNCESESVTPEYWGALGVDYHFSRPHLTLGGSVGVRMPSYQTDSNDFVWLIGEAGYMDEIPLPDGDTPNPEIATRLFVQWDAAEILSLLLSVQYVRDPNRVRYSTLTQAEYLDEHRLGILLTAQGRF